jgi:hypothetical protein
VDARPSRGAWLATVRERLDRLGARDFRVHPAWAGDNPLPNPPWNDKGLLEEGGTPKPAFHEMQRLFHATPPLR